MKINRGYLKATVTNLFMHTDWRNVTKKNQGSSQTDNNEVSQSTVVISSINNALKDWISEVAV